MLILDLSPDDVVTIGDNITIKFLKKTGQVCRVAIDADRSIPINSTALDRKKRSAEPKKELDQSILGIKPN